jgi:hypothetical protein
MRGSKRLARSVFCFSRRGRAVRLTPASDSNPHTVRRSFDDAEMLDNANSIDIPVMQHTAIGASCDWTAAFARRDCHRQAASQLAALLAPCRAANSALCWRDIAKIAPHV